MTLPLDPSLFRLQAAVLILLADSMDAAMQGSASSPIDVEGWLSSETITAKEMNGLTVWKFLFCLAAEMVYTVGAVCGRRLWPMDAFGHTSWQNYLHHEC